MRPLFYIIFLCTVFSCDLIYSQAVVNGVVKDKESGEPLIFCHVWNQSSGNGTISNEEGAYSLKCDRGDTLTFKYLGFVEHSLVVREVIDDQYILLERDVAMIDQVTITADNEYLYKLVSDCRTRLKADKEPSHAKAYMNVISFCDNLPTEHVETYYNSTTAHGSLQEIDYKHGRALLQRHRQGGYFLNIDISKALVIYSIIKGHERLPGNPLQLSKRKLKRKYVLDLDQQIGNHVAISFTPKKNSDNLFSGIVTIDKETKEIAKVIFRSSNHRQKVFRPIGVSQIDSLDYAIEYGYHSGDNKNRLSYVNLDYTAHMSVLGTADSLRHDMVVNTSSIMHLYDYNAAFILPYFIYPQNLYDYRLYAVTSHNDIWKVLQGSAQIESNITQKEVKRMLTEKGTVFTDSLTYAYNENLLFEANYRDWSDTMRVLLPFKKKILARGNVMTIADRIDKQVFRTDNLHVAVQLYLDHISEGPEMVYHSVTLFDPYRSFNHLDESPQVNWYVNIIFDLAEIQRRKMVDEIEASNMSEFALEQIHKKNTSELERVINNFQKECFAGKVKNKIDDWNGYVKDALGVDNAKIFLNDELPK